jgi:hypothetical protein
VQRNKLRSKNLQKQIIGETLQIGGFSKLYRRLFCHSFAPKDHPMQISRTSLVALAFSSVLMVLPSSQAFLKEKEIQMAEKEDLC